VVPKVCAAAHCCAARCHLVCHKNVEIKINQVEFGKGKRSTYLSLGKEKGLTFPKWERINLSHCVSNVAKNVNKGMVPSKLKRHFTTKHTSSK